MQEIPTASTLGLVALALLLGAAAIVALRRGA
ncbi:MAG: IPTL-CTERM sorting domain-containing protein [Thermoanaerobaculia bacterium]|nr:IPTL-CTERM sorting domain-containing protein [Thermoanaerobaculia bacterium]